MATSNWIVERVDGNSTRPQDDYVRTEVGRFETPEAARAAVRDLRVNLERGSTDWFEVRPA